MAAYALAIDQGADYIEPDLVVTRDGVLVARHENELSGTTDVAQHPEFGARRTRKRIDGRSMEGWFVEDFTLDELKTLRAREPHPEVRLESAGFDGCEEIPTLQEILFLMGATEGSPGDSAPIGTPGAYRCGIYPELKHPLYFAKLGFDTPRMLVEVLRSHGLSKRDQPVFIQSFDVRPLIALRRLTDLPLVQLLDIEGGPFDSEVYGDGTTFRDMITPAGLARIATYADAIGPVKRLVDQGANGAENDTGAGGTLLDQARHHGLLVHPWTFRTSLLSPAGSGTGSNASRMGAVGELADEIRHFLVAGVDGLFTDNPDVAVGVRDVALAEGGRE